MLSLPWTEYQAPSLPIGHLSSYLRTKGLDITARHLHLDFALRFELADYDAISHGPYSLGEAIFASSLLRGHKKKLLLHIDRFLRSGGGIVGDARKALERIYRSHDWSKYDLVGFSVNHIQLFASLLFASWLKRDHPHIRILFGGSSVSKRLGEAVIEHFDFVDWCIDGEGEQALEALLNGLERGHADSEASVPGLIYRTRDGIASNDRALLNSLEGFADPDFDHYFEVLDGDAGSERPFSPYLPVEESRGCTNRCAFCNFNYYYSPTALNRPYRPRPSEEVAAMIDRLARKYRTGSIYIVGLLLTKASCRKLFRALEKYEGDFRFFTQIHAGMPKEDLSLMKEMGISEVQIGVEALDTGLLKKMNKGTRLIDNLEIMKFCEELGITSILNLMVGFPTETQADVDRSTKAVDYATSYAPYKKVAVFELRDGSPVDMDPHKYGVKSVRETPLFGRSLRAGLSGIDSWCKSFRTDRKKRDYKAFYRRIEKWRHDYEDSARIGLPLLFYMDFGDFIIINDNREGHASIALDGWKRDLYLFCDRIRRRDEISARFQGIDERDLNDHLKKLFRMKLIFAEDDCYLSLAIRSKPESRRYMPFIDEPWKL